MSKRPARALALSSSRDRALPWLVLPVAAVVLLLSMLAAQADNIIKSHGISTFGPLKYAADFKHLDYVNPDAPKGGEISEWTFGSFDSMHPYTIKGRGGALSSIFFESLLTGTADEIGASYGLLADMIEYPEDRSWVIFHLRPEAAFSDGSPLTAEDVLFSYETFRDRGLSSFRAQLQKKVESAEVLSPQQIKFIFKEDFPKRDLIQDVGGLPVFSKANFVARDFQFEDTNLEPMLGSGAYVLGKMDVGQSITYDRNPDYWGKDLPINA